MFRTTGIGITEYQLNILWNDTSQFKPIQSIH